MAQTDQRGRDLHRRARFHDGVGEGQFFLARGLGQKRILQHALQVPGADLFGAGRTAPSRFNIGRGEDLFDPATAAIGRHQDRDALAARAARPATAVQKAGSVHRQVSMDHKAQIRQVQTARGNVGGDTDAGPAITQGLQGIGPLALGQFARQGDDLKTALTQAGIEPPHIFAGRTEDQSPRRIDVTQHIDHRPFDLVGGAADDAIFDIAMGFVQAGRIDPHRIALIAAREGGDIFCNGGREQQGPALDRRGIQNEFQIIAKAEIEHLVGLVQHGDLQGRQVQMAALNMVAQTAGGADNNVGPVAEQTLLAPRIHTADARDDDRASLAIEPG